MIKTSTSKLIDPLLYHIKEKSVMKACWTDVPCNCWGEHWVIVDLDYRNEQNSIKLTTHIVSTTLQL